MKTFALLCSLFSLAFAQNANQVGSVGLYTGNGTQPTDDLVVPVRIRYTCDNDCIMVHIGTKNGYTFWDLVPEGQPGYNSWTTVRERLVFLPYGDVPILNLFQLCLISGSTLLVSLPVIAATRLWLACPSVLIIMNSLFLLTNGVSPLLDPAIWPGVRIQNIRPHRLVTNGVLLVCSIVRRLLKLRNLTLLGCRIPRL